MGLIDTFDPALAEDRARVRRLTSVTGPWDISLRIVQGGKTRTIMMHMRWNEGTDPNDADSYRTRAVNLPVSDGKIEKIEMLLTPDAAINGMPDNPRVLDSRDCRGVRAEGTPEHFECDLGRGPITWAFAGTTPPAVQTSALRISLRKSLFHQLE